MLEKSSLLEQIRMMIEKGEGDIISGGRLLPERELMEFYKVGRRTVREALQELEDEGLLYRRQGKGTFISAALSGTTNVSSLTSNTSPREIIEVRQEIEPMLAKLAAMRATPADIEQLKQFIARGRQAENGRQYERWDSAFHIKIAQSVRNELFWSVFELVNSVRAEQKWVNAREKSFSKAISEELLKQHQTIVDAIEDRDPRAAEECMRKHIQTVSHRMTGAEVAAVELI